MSWDSHALIAERLKQAAGDDARKRMAAGYIAVSTDWCWRDLIANAPDAAMLDWAMETMRGWVRDGDNAPDVLVRWGQHDD